jgi:hypothetical protein
MRAADIVYQLAAKLPLFSDKFTTNIALTSLTQAAGVATAATAVAHGLAAGQQANIVGAKVAIPLTSLTRSGTVGTAVSASSHDLTRGYSQNVEITGAPEANFNGSFALLNVPDRFTATFTMPDSGATAATGSPLLLNASNYLSQYNGLHAITAVPTPTSFQFAVPAGLYSPAYGSISARSLPRVSAALSEDVILDAYTAQPQDAVWAFVVLNDVVASKSRQTETDASSNIQRGEYFRIQVIQPFTVYVLIPTAAENAARSARDLCEELLRPLCQALVLKKFDSLLSVGAKNPVQFLGHGFAAYSRPFYMHAFQFGQLGDMTFADTVGYDDDVAFRDIGLTMHSSLGTGIIQTANINLDEG